MIIRDKTLKREVEGLIPRPGAHYVEFACSERSGKGFKMELKKKKKKNDSELEIGPTIAALPPS